MKECDCKSSNKIKANETCLFCCTKHLSAAVALTNDYLINDINLLRAASQIKLASWHFDKNFENFANRCNQIVNKILNLNKFKDDLVKLTNDTWTLLKENKNKNFLYYETNISSLEGLKPSFSDGMLCISNAIELYNYEAGYEDVNQPYVIGQLILAAWHFQNHYKNYALKSRLIYNKINSDMFKISELIEFRDFLWKKFKQENCIIHNDLLNL